MITSNARSPARNRNADLLKGTAVLLMIQVHLMEQFATPDLFRSVIGKISLLLGGPPAAPVFLAVMGYFVARSTKTPLQHLRRGILLILGGIALNIGLNANLLYSISQGRFSLDPLAFILGADILPLAGLSIIAITFIRPLAKNSVGAWLTLSILVASIAPFIPVLGTPDNFFYYLNPFLWGDYWWSYFPLFPWLAYSLVGVAFACFDRTSVESISRRQQLIALSILGALILFTSPFAIPRITDLPQYYHHGVLLYLWNAGFLLVWTSGASLFTKRFERAAVTRYFQWLGRRVTSAYVFQWLIIGNIATELHQMQNLPQLAMWFVIVTATTTLLVFLFASARQRLVTLRPASS